MFMNYRIALAFKLPQKDKNEDKWKTDSWTLNSEFEKYHMVVFDYQEI